MSDAAASFLQIIKHRRTYLLLGNDSPVAESEIEHAVKTCILHCPSTFNSQSTRAIVLFNIEHRKLWDLVIDVVQHLVPEQLLRIKARVSNFRRAHGTVLLFEDQAVVDELVHRMPHLAHAFPQWSEHTAGLHHYAIWTALDAAGLGCNLQHFNPLIDGTVQEVWGTPKDWALKAQLVFGSIIGESSQKTFHSLGERYRSYGKS